MTDNGAIGLIGSLGLLAIVLLGFILIVRGLFTGMRRSMVPLSSPVGFGQGALGRTIASFLAFAVAYKFFFEGYGERLYGFGSMLGMAILALAAMALIPALETLVAVAALTLFLMQNTVVFGPQAIWTFLILLFIYVPLRWVLGR